MARAEKDKADIWMPIYIGDYLADTTRLTTEQHGAYFLLMMDYWRSGPPPDDDEILQNVTRLSAFLWKKTRPVLEKLFSVQDGAWHHKRIDEEIATALEGKGAASDKAKKAAEARWGKKDAPSNAQVNAPDMLEECPLPSPSPLTPKTLKTGGITVDSGTSASEQISGTLSAADISISLIGWERERGKAARGIMPGNQQVIDLAGKCVTRTELRAAYDMAVADRQATGDVNPVNAGFIGALLVKVRNPPKPRPRADDWDRSKEGIERKGREMGILGRGTESHDSLKARIHEAILAGNRDRGATA